MAELTDDLVRIRARHKHVVRSKHPDAFLVTNTEQQTAAIKEGNDAPHLTVARTLGVGVNGNAAWADAAANVERGEIDNPADRGSPTWSLASDEQFWKGKT